MICEDTQKEFFIKGLTEIDVKDIDAILSILSTGERNRHYAETVMNRHSSRSHTIFRISIQIMQRDIDINNEEGEQTDSDESGKTIFIQSILVKLLSELCRFSRIRKNQSAF